jgi:hypothetical protein
MAFHLTMRVQESTGRTNFERQQSDWAAGLPRKAFATKAHVEQESSPGIPKSLGFAILAAEVWYLLSCHVNSFAEFSQTSTVG